MRMHLSRATTGAVALVVAVSLAGCEEDDGPGSAPPPDSPSVPETSSPSEPTTTPTETGPVEPTLPAGAQTEDEAGAKDFVAFYWEVVSYARLTGDVALLRSLTAEDCAGCNGGVESIERVYARGGRIIGGRYELLRAAPDQTQSGAWAVATRVSVARSRTIGAGNLNQSVRAGELGFDFILRHDGNKWLITFLDVA